MNDDQKKLIYLNSKKDLHAWEKINFPLVKTNAGYELLICISITAMKHEEIRLKNIYYSLPYSEKTLRLLLRDLENNGWIAIVGKAKDMRYREITLTKKFLNFLDSWLLKNESL
jgi:hypothetical protein